MSQTADPKTRGLGELRDLLTVDLFLGGPLAVGAAGPGITPSATTPLLANWVAPYNCNIIRATAFAGTGPITTPAMIDIVKQAANGKAVTSLMNSRIVTDAVVATSTSAATGVTVGSVTSTAANWSLADQGLSLVQFSSATVYTVGNILATFVPYGSQIDFGGGVTAYPVLTPNQQLLSVPFICPAAGVVAAGSPTGLMLTNRLIIPPVASGTASSIVNFPVVTVPNTGATTPTTPTMTLTTNFPSAPVGPQTAAYAPTYAAGPTAFTNPGAQEATPQILAGDVVYPFVVFAGGTAAANVTITLQIERI